MWSTLRFHACHAETPLPERYTFAAIFAVQNLAAANLSRYWGLSQTWQTLAFYGVAPVIILAINFCGVGVSNQETDVIFLEA